MGGGRSGLGPFLRHAIFVFVGIASLVLACSTVEYTGRTRIILISEEQELELGRQAYQQVLAEGKLSRNARQIEVVQRVGQRIAAVADRPQFEWEFVVIDDRKTVNAFCLPGGKVAFYTGILPVCKHETGLAVVMGHEVAHAVARHGAERISQALVLELGADILAGVIAGKDPEHQKEVASLLGVGFGIAFALPFSRKHESEADHIGLMLMAKAGYDPREAPRFWDRMEKLGGKEPPQFLSTHPSHEKRKEDLEALIPDAIPLYEAATGIKTGETRQVIRGGVP